MAKKLSTELVKTLKNLGITAKTEEEAHKKLVAALEKEGIEGMEDESLAALIDMADGFLNDSDDEAEEVEDTDAEMDELADEVEDEESDDDEPEEEEEPEEDEEPEEEPEKPAKKEKVAKSKKEEKAEKPAKAVKTTSSRGQKLDPKNNPEDRKVLDEIKAMFGDDYSFDYVKSNGATVKHIGKNGKRGVVLIENLTKHNNGTVTCNLYLLTMTKQTDILDEMNIDYSLCWTKAPMMKSITLEEVKEILEKVFETITGAVVKIDKRLGDNRKKMEENLKKTEKKAAKKSAAKAEPEPEEVEEEDEAEEEKPAKKATAKKSTKKAKK